jgi:hypothetical protein
MNPSSGSKRVPRRPASGKINKLLLEDYTVSHLRGNPKSQHRMREFEKRKLRRIF